MKRYVSLCLAIIFFFSSLGNQAVYAMDDNEGLGQESIAAEGEGTLTGQQQALQAEVTVQTEGEIEETDGGEYKPRGGKARRYKRR